jgi:hypothetical protein
MRAIFAQVENVTYRSLACRTVSFVWSLTRTLACSCVRSFVRVLVRWPVRSFPGACDHLPVHTTAILHRRKVLAHLLARAPLLRARLLVFTLVPFPAGLPRARLSFCSLVWPFYPSLARLFTRHLACSPVCSLTRSPVCLFDRSSSRGK